jgi:hypothetical protein
MKIQARRCDTKRHTLGYKVGSKWRTRNQTWELAKAGRIDGVSAYRKGRTRYVQALPGYQRLYDLPIQVED